MDDCRQKKLALELFVIAAVVVIVTMICGTIIIAMTVRKSAPSDGRMLDVFFRQGTLLQSLTAVVIVYTALILRLLDQIKSEATVSILSATAGYVLGGLSRRQTS